MPTSVIAGFALGFSLILAIGAQNAFILRQGLRREHVFFLCLTCAVSDAILIGAGVAGFGTLAQAAPWFETVMRYGGAAFLIWYGLRSLRSSWLGGSVMEIGNGKRTSLKAALLTVFAFTWLNPHVYLDTVVLIGSISAQYDDRLGFALGAMTSSFVFFFSLGYGASILSPVFARPRAWQVLDAGIGVVMLGIALKLVTM
ncbi:LysE/ArgO family amino acid transporter [Ruegeria marisrubri]|uniref:LysE/ArgO family amino acid transporter n=1 Tax=Ruegeria TaxID=97050 RepID=UPI001487630A|nr:MULTISPECIES: LysE/ArgO family amino acid transporter [Ruegeria]MCA0905354.1 LysE/ArgO family amino acid transporter [Ruegeria marisrubri]NOE25213.1 LysE family transporter [Ruegeria sp. HKCCD6157]